ncbi:MAG TPA: hypothetical protein VKR42_14455 [Ktedonobacteraceae bacterium]|nr:hypothetical protein [Ktedonobacteraceae bacterium]
MSLRVGSLVYKAGKTLKITSLVRNVQRYFFHDEYIRLKSNRVTQVMLSVLYKDLLSRRTPLPSFEDIEFRAFSQNGEDGILLYIFALIGTTNKKCVEICGGDGLECNTANLVINHGWRGLLFDGNKKLVEKGRRFYARCPDTWLWPPKLVHAWITTDNVNALIEEQGFSGEIDLLSLDMDGVDYWVWQAIECIKPRVVVLEYNNLLGPDASLTVPCKPDFQTPTENEPLMNYYGASLPAFAKLAKQKGYRLVGCEQYGFNAFFVRSGIGEDMLPEVSVSTCFDHPFAQHAMEVRRVKVADREWVEV